MLFIVALK